MELHFYSIVNEILYFLSTFHNSLKFIIIIFYVNKFSNKYEKKKK